MKVRVVLPPLSTSKPQPLPLLGQPCQRGFIIGGVKL